mmetsp:Transcript_13458/g.30518  ORF Transcript_13458/g.30518 Transcript_13458/m.30518 type:complete len:765 (-) Transcript_13458:186-2480(-)
MVILEALAHEHREDTAIPCSGDSAWLTGEAAATLQSHGWEGSQFQEPPDQDYLLSDLTQHGKPAKEATTAPNTRGFARRLRSMGFHEKTAEKLGLAGMQSISDVDSFSDEQLLEVGIDAYDCRKLRRNAAKAVQKQRQADSGARQKRSDRDAERPKHYRDYNQEVGEAMLGMDFAWLYGQAREHHKKACLALHEVMMLPLPLPPNTREVVGIACRMPEQFLLRPEDVACLLGRAFIGIVEAGKLLQRGADILKERMDNAEHSLCDALSWFVQLQVPLGNRERYMQVLERTLGSDSLPVPKELISKLMHSHKKAVAPNLPSTFSSNNSLLAARRGRVRQRKGHEHEDKAQVTAPFVFAPEPPFRKPPGLEDVSEQSYPSWTTRDRRNIILHERGARTCMSHPSGLAPDLDFRDPLERASDCEDECSSMLILSELTQVLLWRRYVSGYEDAPEWAGDSDEVLKTPNGFLYYPRPGAKDLVKSLVTRQDKRCVFAVVSGMGHWHCLPAVRVLLEKTLPGHWHVEESMEGRWSDYTSSELYEIRTIGHRLVLHGSRCHSEDGSVDWDLDILPERDGRPTCKCVFYGVSWIGHVTLDGWLEWNREDHPKVAPTLWLRAGRSDPPSLVSKRRDLPRVYVFDRDRVIEQMPVEDGCPKAVNRSEAGWQHSSQRGWVKELHKVWSALSECGAGTFHERNTCLLDLEKQSASHQQNVLVVPQWQWAEEADKERAMGSIRDFLGEMLDELPPNGDVAAYLSSNQPTWPDWHARW